MSKSTVEWYRIESDANWKVLAAPHVQEDPPPLTPAVHRRLDAQRCLEGVAALLLLLAITYVL